MSEEMLEGTTEEAPLSAEELFEQHKAEIEAAFEEKGFFRRMGDMFAGFSQPKSSAEYKLAKVELQRLAAPILAILLPTLGVITLIVVTAISAQQKEVIQVDISKVEADEQELEEEQEEEIEETPPDEVVDIQVDTPVVGPSSDVVAPSSVVSTEPVSVKPAAEDSVALIKSPVTMKSMAGSRTPGMRGQFLRGGGSYGDAATEGAVMKALRWLKKTQNADGSWGNNQRGSRPSMTGFALLTYLAHGEVPGSSKEFGDTVKRGIEYLCNSVSTLSGGKVLYANSDGNEYATMIGTYALCEAYGMTKNPNIRDAVSPVLRRIIDCQTPTGGWDYKLKKDSTRDDLSLGGWGLQALKAAKMAGIHLDGQAECLSRAIQCLKTRNFQKGFGGFSYTPQTPRRHTGLTATGCLALQLLGHSNAPQVASALNYMRNWEPAFDGAGMHFSGEERNGAPCPQYYCYYATQCKYQAGMAPGASKQNLETWQKWNIAMKKLYVSSIITPKETIPGPDGKPKAIGYWPWTNDKYGQSIGGDTMATCLCALQLMVYYRYLPTTQTSASKVDGDEGGGDAAKKSADVNVEVDI